MDEDGGATPTFLEQNFKIPVECTVTISVEHFLQKRSLKFQVRSKNCVIMLPDEGTCRNML